MTDATTLPGILACAAASADEACAGQFIDAVGPRLYRRPLTTDERGELVELYRSVSARAGFTVGLKWSLVAMLESPEFLYRSELGDDTGTLTPYERATELSFTYGSSTPSPELLAKAASGALATPDALEAEARALLATPSGQEALRAFFREWTGYRRIIGTDRANVGNFTKDIAPLLAEETKRFIDAIVLDGNGTVKDLLTSETTYMNSRLATFYRYGVGTESSGPSRVQRGAASGCSRSRRSSRASRTTTSHRRPSAASSCTRSCCAKRRRCGPRACRPLKMRFLPTRRASAMRRSTRTAAARRATRPSSRSATGSSTSTPPASTA